MTDENMFYEFLTKSGNSKTPSSKHFFARVSMKTDGRELISTTSQFRRVLAQIPNSHPFEASNFKDVTRPEISERVMKS